LNDPRLSYRRLSTFSPSNFKWGYQLRNGSRGAYIPNCTKPRTSALTKFAFYLRHVGQFRNAGGSKSNGIKNRGQILNILPLPSCQN